MVNNMKRKKLSKTLRETKLVEWKSSACNKPDCVYSPACNKLPISDDRLQVSPMLRWVIQLMRDYHHYPELRVELIANALHISVRQLERLFKTIFHCTYTDCLRRMRSDHAKLILIKHCADYMDDIMDKIGIKSTDGYYHTIHNPIKAPFDELPDSP